MDRFKEYSKKKAQEVFDSMPYTRSSDAEFSRHIMLRRRANMRHRLKVATEFATRCAAILFIPLLAYTLYNYNYSRPDNYTVLPAESGITAEIPQQQPLMEYSTNSGVKGKVILPDSSEVWMNCCSSIKIPAQFSNAERYVELEGEAYFKVRSNSNWPMLIKSKGVTTKVLGTEFNLSAYNDDEIVKLTLVNGKVELQKKNAPKITLNPNEQAIIFDTPGKKSIKVRSSQGFANELAWKDGYLIFDNTPMIEVIKKMERWYGVNFQIPESDILKYKFTGRFKAESVTQVLDLLSISSNIRYRINKNSITLYRL